MTPERPGAAPTLLLALGLATACTTAGTNGRYVGQATPAQPGPLCQPTRAVLQVRGTAILFIPDEGTWVLEGTIAPDGKLTAAKSRVVSNTQIYATTFTGTLTGEAITGTYTTPRCTSTISLTKT